MHARSPCLALVFACTCSCMLLLAQRARACAMCETGDPTLVVMGAQQPFAQRLRVALELQYRTDAVGREGTDRIELNEQRMSFSVAYAPASWLMVSGSVPLIRRELTDVVLAQDTLATLGDVELLARGFVLRDREFAPRHLLALVGGIRLPTAPLERDAQGAYREPELQSGSGSFDPLAGVSYAFFADPWSFYVSEVVYVPTQGRTDFRIGTSWRATHAVQYQLARQIALRVGADFRVEARSMHHGRPESDSGGMIAFASPSLVWSPAMDVVFNLDVHIPVWNALYGTHDEGLFGVFGAAYDI